MKDVSKKTLLTAAVLAAMCLHSATAQVVSDDACPKYAVDVQSFATCDGDRVARSPSAEAVANLDPDSVPASKRSHSALHVTAREAHRLIQDPAVRAVLVDVRSSVEVALSGQPVPVHVHLAYEEPKLPLRWDAARNTWSMTSNPYFGEQLMARLAARGIGPDSTVIMICSSGERSAQAANELADFGYEHVVTVVDGFEGDLGADDRRSVNGWKNAGLPWTARVDAALAASAR